jgi:putative ABC transport system ATP-binding protein
MRPETTMSGTTSIRPATGSDVKRAGAGVELEALDVHKHFDRGHVHALNGATLRVERGEFVALTGPSGSGKSTLLHLFAALDTPTSGRIVVDGRDITALHRLDGYRRETVGLVFQLHNLLPHLTARQNLEVAMFGTNRTRGERRRRADLLLAELQLAGLGHRRPPELSGGERQRVAIARALANDPRVLLADEPTGSLDSKAVQETLALLQRIRSQRELTIVLVTHDPQVAAAADRCVTICDGRVTA